MSMSKRETFRRHAAACLRLAEEELSPANKALLLNMAQRWYDLAEQSERGNRAREHYARARPEADAEGVS